MPDATTNGTHPPLYASVHDFRRRVLTTTTLPSGLTVQIRFVQNIDLLSAWDLPMPSSAEKPDDAPPIREEMQRGVVWRDMAIVAGCVQPRFVARGEGTDEAVGLEELSNSDYLALSQAILAHSGLAPEVAERVEAFRQDAERPADSTDRGEIRGTPARSPADDASATVSGSPDRDDQHDRGDTGAVPPTAGTDGGPAEPSGTI
jgi:hypothetical protein